MDGSQHINIPGQPGSGELRVPATTSFFTLSIAQALGHPCPPIYCFPDPIYDSLSACSNARADPL